jgi:hypothetical protein
MTSIIKVDQIQTAAGGAPTAAGLGINTTGTVLQVVSVQMARAAIDISSTSFTSTTLSKSIVTKSTNSLVLVTLSGGGWYDNGNPSCTLWVTFQRSISSGAYTYPMNAYNDNYGLIRMSGDGNTWNIKPYSADLMDQPQVASGTTIDYRVVARTNSVNKPSQFNSSDRGAPVLTLMEIAG